MRMRKTLVYDSDDVDPESVPLLQDDGNDACAALFRVSSHKPSQTFNVVRPVYEQDTLNKDADYHPRQHHLKHKARKVVRRCGYGECLANSLPILKWLPKYNIKSYLVGDMVAGATTAVLHIPQGMAYALLAEVPPIVGLYMAFFPVLIYVLLGTSPHISIGTFAVVCLMAGKVVAQHSPHVEIVNGSAVNVTVGALHDGPAYSPMEVLTAVCFTVGMIQLIMWVLRLGMVSTLLSEPLVSGFTTAAALYVLTSQIKDIFGIPLPKQTGNFKLVLTVVNLIQRITMINWMAFGISVVFCIVIALNNELLRPLVSKYSRVPVPIELVAIVTGTLLSKYCKLRENYNLNLVGNIPTGLPVPEVPPMELIPVVALDAFTITVVSYTITMSMVLIFAAKEEYEVDANQELLALGASNIFGSFFSCSPICASLSRSYIQHQVGAKTPITSVVTACLILCVLLWIGPFFQDLPRCVLGAIIVVSLKGMFMQVKDLKKFWRLSQLDAAVWLVSFLVTMLVNIDIGLGAGLLASVATLFLRSQKPYTCLLGRVLNTDIYLDVKRYRAAEEIPNVKIFHYCGGLNFATKNMFRAILFRKVGCLDRPADDADEDNNLAVSGSESVQWRKAAAQHLKCVIIDATALSYVDAPGVKVLVSVHKELVSHNIIVLLSGANAPVLEMIERYNSLETDRLQLAILPTVHDAVVYYKILQSKSSRKPSVGITITEK